MQSFTPKILVCQEKDKKTYFLRIHFFGDRVGAIRFETNAEFTKSEADYRAMALSSKYGWDRDELPTHPSIEVYPKDEIDE